MNAKSTDLVHVIKSIRLAFNRLKMIADDLHADHGISAAMRAVMEALSDAGPMTVPKIAEAKGVTRQHIQVLCDQLIAKGILAAEPNSKHARSPLVGLTKAGRQQFAEIAAREAELLERLARGFDPARMAQLRATLAEFARQLSEIKPGSSHDDGGE